MFSDTFSLMTTRQAATKKKYDAQRAAKIPPHVPLQTLRIVAGLTIDALAVRMQAVSGKRYSAGAISNIESGRRGASAQFISDLAAAYGIDPSVVATDYLPRTWKVAS